MPLCSEIPPVAVAALLSAYEAYGPVQALLLAFGALLVTWVVLAYRTPRIVSWIFTPLYIAASLGLLALGFCVSEACPDLSDCAPASLRVPVASRLGAEPFIELPAGSFERSHGYGVERRERVPLGRCGVRVVEQERRPVEVPARLVDQRREAVAQVVRADVPAPDLLAGLLYLAPDLVVVDVPVEVLAVERAERVHSSLEHRDDSRLDRVSFASPDRLDAVPFPEDVLRFQLPYLLVRQPRPGDDFADRPFVPGRHRLEQLLDLLGRQPAHF